MIERDSQPFSSFEFKNLFISSKKAAIFYEEIDVAKITYYKHRMTEI